MAGPGLVRQQLFSHEVHMTRGAGMNRQQEEYESLMEEVRSLTVQFVTRIEAIRPMQLPRFPGPPPGTSHPDAPTATATRAYQSNRTPVRVGSGPAGEADEPDAMATSSRQQESFATARTTTTTQQPVSNEAIPSSRAAAPMAQPASSSQSELSSDAFKADNISFSKSHVPPLDLAAMQSASAQEAPPAQQQSHLSGAARVRMSQFDDTEKLQKDISRQQQQLESGPVKIEGQLSSVSFMVEEWEDAAGPLQTSQSVQNAVQVLPSSSAQMS